MSEVIVSTPAASQRVDILGCQFNAWSTEETLAKIESLIKSDERGHLSTVNVAILMMMRADASLADYIAKSAMTVADGQPLIWVSRYIRKPLPERVTGVDLVEALAQLAAQHDWGVYLMGATQNIVQQVAKNLSAKYPALKLSGVDDGYFTVEEAADRAAAIADSGAKILIAAMGVPRQEMFIQSQWQKIGVNFAIGVGGSFDVLAGVTPRAPLWMQRVGLEWLFRLMQEPRRLFKRYLVTNSRFIFLVLRDIVFSRNKS